MKNLMKLLVNQDNRLKDIITEYEEEDFLSELECNSNQKEFIDYCIKRFIVGKFYKLINKEALEQL